MTEKKIYILTGNIQSGKTTTLMQWSAGRTDVFGILSPVVNGKRFFINIQTGEEFEMEAKQDEIGVLKIGKYRFKKKSFDKAIDILQQAIKEKRGWLIVDEIGPLELKKQGFCEILNEILNTESSLQIILVARESLVKDVINFFRLNEYEVELLNTGSQFFNQ